MELVEVIMAMSAMLMTIGGEPDSYTWQVMQQLVSHLQDIEKKTKKKRKKDRGIKLRRSVRRLRWKGIYKKF